MVYRLIFLIICFLIVSCDLPNEAENDCHGISLGLAYIDDCGRCVGGDTELQENQDKDVCGECFGNSSYNDCMRCNDAMAINYFDIEQEFVDNDLCIYDLCEDYLPDLDTFSCNESNISGVYDVCDQLSCNDIENPLDICFPNNCDNELTFSDFYGKVLWIEMTASW